MRGTPRRQAQAVVLLGVILFAIQMLGQVQGWWGVESSGDALFIVTGSFLFLGLGALIIGKAESNRVGWVFAGVGLFVLLSGLAGGLADLGLVVFEGLGGALWLSWIAVVGLLLLWFPTGRVPGHRWRWAEWLGLGLLSLMFALYTFADELCTEYAGQSGCLEFVENPIGLPGVPNPEYGWISGPLFAAMAVFALLSLVSLVVRYVRSRGTERQQLKWFLLACVIFVGSLVSLLSVEAVTGQGEGPSWLNLIFGLSLLGLPASATLAILRYRLYDIDRIISRTVTYALVVGLLAIGVALVVTLTAAQFEDPLVVAATTLAVTALFNPLRRRIHLWVDRRFNRSRYDVQRVIDQFAGTLRHRVDPNGVVDGWLEVVEETMQPAGVGVWVRR